MMLDEEDAGKSQLLGGDDVFDEIVVALAVPGRAAAGAGAAEQSEFHDRRSIAALPASPAALYTKMTCLNILPQYNAAKGLSLALQRVSKAEAGAEDQAGIEIEFGVERPLDVVGLAEAVRLAGEQQIADRDAAKPQGV